MKRENFDLNNSKMMLITLIRFYSNNIVKLFYKLHELILD